MRRAATEAAEMGARSNGLGGSVGLMLGLLGSLAGGLAIGVATSYLQGVLPGSSNSLANSGAVWTVVAVGLSALLAGSRPAAIAAGLFALGGEVAGYYAVAAPIRGIATSPSERTLWTLAALVLGPLAGLVAWWLRRGTPRQRALAAAAVSGLVAGEGLHLLVDVAGGNGFAWAEVGLAAAATAANFARPGTPAGHRWAGLLTTLLVTAAVFLAYRQTVLF